MQTTSGPDGSGGMDVAPDRHTRWYQGIQRIYRNAVVNHLRNTLRGKYPLEWEEVVKKPFAKEWPDIVKSADFARQTGAISSTPRDSADYLGVNHFHNLFDVHFDLLVPPQGDTTAEARKQEKAALLGLVKEIRTARDPESHPPGDDMALLDAVRQLDSARRVCAKFDMQAANQLEALITQVNTDSPSDFGLRGKDPTQRQPGQGTLSDHVQAEALLLGPVQALGLGSRLEQAHRLATDAPADAARLYAQIADALRERFPGYADQFERLGALAHRAAGDSEASHDLLMKIAIRDLRDRAEPRVTPELAASIEQLDKEVDEVRQARGRAMVHFGRCHEYAGELEKLAECFERLGPHDELAPVIATLSAEAALADRDYQFILDRRETLERASAAGDREIELRVRAALGDAGAPDVSTGLINDASELRFLPAEGTYLCLRGARWCAWNGQLDKAKSLYRLATKQGADVGYDLDVENALWSLTVICQLGDSRAELFETHRMALSIEGSRSYVRVNSRTELRSYQNLANRQLPDAHLWAQYRLLESIRSGCLHDELESHTILSRIYVQSDESLDALEHAILGGSQQLVNEVAPTLDQWPKFLSDMVVSKAPWVRQNALLALGHVGDLAPPEEARRLLSELLRQLPESAHDARVAPDLLKALGTLILESADSDIEQLMPYLEENAVREPETYRLTDPGVMTLAARLYRFRPGFRQQAAAVLGEMSIGSHTGDWARVLDECGDDREDLIEAFERVAGHNEVDISGSLSDLCHLTDGTRAVWQQRLQFITDHPLGPRSSHDMGPRYDVPPPFLREQGPEASLRYVEKLVAIGCDIHQFVSNRGAALAAAARVVDLLSACEKQCVYSRVRPLAEQPAEISTMDQFHAQTQHPLSRFRISFGRATNVQTAAGWLLAGTAVSAEERSAVEKLVLEWVRSSDSTLQGAGAAILTSLNLSSGRVGNSELARHGNPAVRKAAVWMPGMQESPDDILIEQLASDPDRTVRIAVARALPRFASMNADTYERIRSRLTNDASAIVRTLASAL